MQQNRAVDEQKTKPADVGLLTATRRTRTSFSERMKKLTLLEDIKLLYGIGAGLTNNRSPNSWLRERPSIAGIVNVAGLLVTQRVRDKISVGEMVQNELL